MDPFGTGQTLPPLQLPQSTSANSTVTPLKKPPKWIRRPVGASFAVSFIYVLHRDEYFVYLFVIVCASLVCVFKRLTSLLFFSSPSLVVNSFLWKTLNQHHSSPSSPRPTLSMWARLSLIQIFWIAQTNCRPLLPLETLWNSARERLKLHRTSLRRLFGLSWRYYLQSAAYKEVEVRSHLLEER